MDGPRWYYARQRNTDIISFHLCGIKKQNKWANITKDRYREELSGCQMGRGVGSGRVGEMDECDEKAHISSYKTSKS